MYHQGMYTFRSILIVGELSSHAVELLNLKISAGFVETRITSLLSQMWVGVQEDKLTPSFVHLDKSGYCQNQKKLSLFTTMEKNSNYPPIAFRLD